MAKGVEDTAFYRYARLLALNDVGGDPGRFSLRVEQFHAANARAGGAVPAQPARHPDARHQALGRRARADRRAGVDAGGVRGATCGRWLNVCRSLTSGGAPEPVEQLFIFQTLLGAWPISAERLEAYLEKALREAKVHTSWVEPDERARGRGQAFARALSPTATSCGRSSPSSARWPRPATASRSASCCSS